MTQNNRLKNIKPEAVDEDCEEHEHHEGCQHHKPLQPFTRGLKIGRNDPCPCGSGKKYKKCCIG